MLIVATVVAVWVVLAVLTLGVFLAIVRGSGGTDAAAPAVALPQGKRVPMPVPAPRLTTEDAPVRATADR